MITLYIYPGPDYKFDATDMVKSVGWSGDINSLPRQIDISLHNTNDITSRQTLIPIDPGNAVVLLSDGEEIFRGHIFKVSVDASGATSFTAYDHLIFVTKNTDSILIKDRKISDVMVAQCKKYVIPVGYIEDTGVKVGKMVCQGQALSDIWLDGLEETKKLNGKSYKIYAEKGEVRMISRANSSKMTITVNDVIGATKERSVEDSRTQVMVTKGSLDPSEESAGEGGEPPTKFQSVTERDEWAAAHYGVMQQVETADDKATIEEMRQKAKQILKDMSGVKTTLNMDFIGNVACTTGNRIEVVDDITGIVGEFYITADDHSWDGGVYKMSLQLSTKLE